MAIENKLEQLLEQTWNSKEFSEFFMENYEPDLAIVVKEALREQGYPITANYINIDFFLYSENKGTWDFWASEAEKEIVDKTNAEIRKFFEANRDMYMYANHKEKFVFKVEFRESPEEFINRQPPKEAVSNALQESWDDRELLEYIKASGNPYEPLFEAIREQLKEERFPNPEKINLNEIRFSVQVRNKLDFDSWAEMAIEKYIYKTLDEFIKNRMFIMYLQNPRYLDFEVEIITLLEEWNEEQELV